jgi:hypothetical protein
MVIFPSNPRDLLSARAVGSIMKVDESSGEVDEKSSEIMKE